jgi:hypothetical protein
MSDLPRCGSGRCGWSWNTQDEDPSQWKAIESIASKLSVNHETLSQWGREDVPFFVELRRWPPIVQAAC